MRVKSRLEDATFFSAQGDLRGIVYWRLMPPPYLESVEKMYEIPVSIQTLASLPFSL